GRRRIRPSTRRSSAPAYMSSAQSPAPPVSAMATDRWITRIRCARIRSRRPGAVLVLGNSRMRMLRFITLAVLAIAWLSFGAAGQTAGKVYRIGYLAIGSSGTPLTVAMIEGLTSGLRQRGYSVGTNLLIESRFAEGKPERLPALAKELLDSKIEVLVTTSYPAARAAKAATSTVPIVVEGAGDPAETGLAASFSRPGGNLTGTSDMASELSTKRLELLKAAVPRLQRVAMLYNAKDIGM